MRLDAAEPDADHCDVRASLTGFPERHHASLPSALPAHYPSLVSMVRDPLPATSPPISTTIRCTWPTLSMLLMLAGVVAACGSDGAGGEARAVPNYDGPVGDNGTFTFIPGPPGTLPGVRVEAVFQDQTFTSDAREVRLVEYDGYETVTRALNTDIFGPQGSLEERLTAAIDRVELTPEMTAFEPLPALIELGDAVGVITDEDRAAHALATFERTIRALDVTEIRGPRTKNECPTRTPGYGYTNIGLFDGRYTIWLVNAYTVEFVGVTMSYAWGLHFAPEGVYISLSSGPGINFPPNFAGMGGALGVGMLVSPEAATRDDMLVSTFEGRSLSVSISIAFESFGLTIFQDSGLSFHRALQVDYGWSIAVDTWGSIFSIIGLNYGVTLADSKHLRSPDDEPYLVFVGGYSGRCAPFDPSDPSSRPEQRVDPDGDPADRPNLDDGADSLEELADLLREMASGDGDDFIDLLRQEIGEAAEGPLRDLSRRENRNNNPNDGDSGSGNGGSGSGNGGSGSGNGGSGSGGNQAPVGGPAEGIPSADNPTFIQDFISRRGTSTCEDCPSTSADGTIDRIHRRFQAINNNNDSIEAAAVDSTDFIQRSVPNPGDFGRMSDSLVGAMDAAFATAFENAAELRGDPDRYVSDQIIYLEAEVGERIMLTFTAREIAELVGATEEDVLGATLCIAGDYSGPRSDDICAVLEEPEMIGAITMSQVTRLLLRVDVDLSTAQGDFPENVDEWTVRPALRLVRARPGPPAGVQLNVPVTNYSGAPTSLTATLVDALGNRTEAEVTYTFYDGAGNVLGTVTTDYGAATLQTILEGASPTVTGIRQETLVDQRGNTYEGYVIEGTMLSAYALVRINDQLIEELGYTLASLDANELGFVPFPRSEDDPEPIPITGTVRLEVINPGDASSGVITTPVR